MIDDKVAVRDLTVGEFSELISEIIKNTSKKKPSLSHGLDGLAKLLGCSKATALKVKQSGKFNSAISQVGRRIVIDNDRLLELMRLENIK